MLQMQILPWVKMTLLAGAFVAVTACSQLPYASSEASHDDLYDALGQQDGIALIVEDMLYGVAGDPRINHNFKGVDIVKLHRLLTEQFCDLSGGPCDYSGRRMAEAHQGMGVDETDFNALVGHLILAMEKHDVPVPAQNRLLARLAPMHSEIVGQ